MEGKFIIIPIEIFVREFESRLLLTLKLAKYGYKVIIGSTTQIRHYTYDLPKGIILEKCISIQKQTRLKRLAKLGNKITVIDEEGLGIDNFTEHYLNERVPQKTIAMTEKYFTWGKNETKFLRNKHPQFKHKIITTGNIRVDLWKERYGNYFEEVVARIKKKHGDYILISSSFSLEHIMGDEYLNHIDNIFEDYGIGSKILNEANIGYYKEFNAFKNLIITLPKLIPETQFILRPHPSENPKHWNNLVQNSNNVQVIYEDSISPWIIASKAVIHSSCTSGIEAFLMRKPVISYIPKTDSSRLNIIGNKVSYKCKNVNQVKYILKNWTKNNFSFNYTDFENKEKILSYYFSNYKGENAYDSIFDEIKNIKINKSKIDIGIFIKIKNRLKLIKQINAMSKENKLYMKQKFPGLSQNLLTHAINRMSKAYDELNGIPFKTKKIDRD